MCNKTDANVCTLSAGTFRGVCKKIDHFPEDADYEADAAEYLLRKFNMTHNKHMLQCSQPASDISGLPLTSVLRSHNLCNLLNMWGA